MQICYEITNSFNLNFGFQIVLNTVYRIARKYHSISGPLYIWIVMMQVCSCKSAVGFPDIDLGISGTVHFILQYRYTIPSLYRSFVHISLVIFISLPVLAIKTFFRNLSLTQLLQISLLLVILESPCPSVPPDKKFVHN